MAKYCSNICRRECERKGFRPRGYRRNGGKVPTREELEELYFQRGLSAREIGKLYGKGKPFVYYRMHQYQLKPRSNQDQKLARQKILNCHFFRPLVKLINEDTILTYVFSHIRAFGYTKLLLWRTKEYDLLGIKQNGSIDRIEIEAHASHFISHHHKCDKVIAYYRTTHNLGVPITYLNRKKFLHYLDKLLGDFSCVLQQS